MGPVFFKQTRHGFNGRPFGIYKFRSMTVMEDGDVVTQARKSDNRVTRVGTVDSQAQHRRACPNS